jgi:hypothetical protein
VIFEKINNYKEFKCFDSSKKGLPIDVATEDFKNSHKQDVFWS